MKAKKSYGQHFLVNQALIQQIVDHIQSRSHGFDILEVGPGRGALTEHLISVQGFRAVEADRDMHSLLSDQHSAFAQKLILRDFLKWPIATEITEQTALVGNFPYNISTQIVFKLLENCGVFPIMIGMFQKEVSDRIISPPGSKTYGILSVLAAHFYTGKTLVRVAPGSFQPPPKVQSSVILLERKEDWKEQLELYRPLRTVVKMAFNQRRKMLRKSLQSLITREQLEEMKLDTKRPEQLGLEEFRALARLI